MLLKVIPLRYAGTWVIAIYFMVQINITLAALNLIPIPPLDGSKILLGIFPNQTSRIYGLLGQNGFIIILLLLFTGILTPVITFIRHLIELLIGIR